MGGQDQEGTGQGQQDEPDPAEEDYRPHKEHIKTALDFIELLKGATLDDDLEPLEADLLERLKNPPQGEVDLTDDEIYSIETFLSSKTLSGETYANIIRAAKKRFQASNCQNDCNSTFEPLSFHSTKKLIEEVSGVSPITHHMCINSCVAFTGVYANLDKCPISRCGESRYETIEGKNVPRKVFLTFPIGPQIQALKRSPDGGRASQYRKKCEEAAINAAAENNGIPLKDIKDVHDGYALQRHTVLGK